MDFKNAYTSSKYLSPSVNENGCPGLALADTVSNFPPQIKSATNALIHYTGEAVKTQNDENRLVLIGQMPPGSWTTIVLNVVIDKIQVTHEKLGWLVSCFEDLRRFSNI